MFELADGPHAALPDGWYASVDVNEVPSTIAIAVTCGILPASATTIVASAQAAYHTDQLVNARCPAAMRVVGGGIDVERAGTLTGESYRISASHPITDGTDQSHPPVIGWRGGVYGGPLVFILPPPPGPRFKVGAICARGVDSTGASIFRNLNSAGPDPHRVTCPAGKHAMAGGVRLPGQWLAGLYPSPGNDDSLAIHQRNAGTYPIGTSWNAEVLRDNSDTFNVYATCASILASGRPVIAEFYNPVLDHYFITADGIEATGVDNGAAGPGWSRTGTSFVSGGNRAACRFYGSLSPGPNSHFYTIDAAECDQLIALEASTPDTQKRWNFETFDFLSSAPSMGSCPVDTVPVYRAYNKGFVRGIDSNHRITPSQADIQQVVARGWINEGVVMCAPE